MTEKGIWDLFVIFRDEAQTGYIWLSRDIGVLALSFTSEVAYWIWTELLGQEDTIKIQVVNV